MDTYGGPPHLVVAAPAAVPAVRWQWSRLPELPPAALYAALSARQQVFAVEQQCAYLDADGLDHHAWHLLGWDAVTDTPALAAYLRLIDPGCPYAEPSIGRVLTVASHRGVGLGRSLMREGIVRSAAFHPGHAIRISAQQQLERFYRGLGFVAISAPYDEDGIPHVAMRLAWQGTSSAG
jgi:ElaA protein